ncbi:MAG: hypothetical protein Q9M13_08325 [Mariprofundales bacterium]|nr:hypothetical protein [Mariprofundales bacterium]
MDSLLTIRTALHLGIRPEIEQQFNKRSYTVPATPHTRHAGLDPASIFHLTAMFTEMDYGLSPQ